MIEYRRDNLLKADVEALVNSVNTVGVMGKGIALQFKREFPENFKAYERACKKGEVTTGKMFTVPVGKLTNPRYIINFPTKEHWRGKSRIEYVKDGLEDLDKNGRFDTGESDPRNKNSKRPLAMPWLPLLSED